MYKRQPINSQALKERIAAINASNRTASLPPKEKKGVAKAVKTLESKHLPKLEEYEKHLDTLGGRNLSLIHILSQK